MKKKNQGRCENGCSSAMAGGIIRPLMIITLAALAGWGIYRLVSHLRNKKFQPNPNTDFPGTSEYSDADVMVGGEAQPFNMPGSESAVKKPKAKK